MSSMEAAIAKAWPEVPMDMRELQQAQGVVLVILDVNKEICAHALNWALGHVARKGDAIRLVGILTHVLNPMGYKCRVDENAWTGANKKILEQELANKKHMLENIENLEKWCEKSKLHLIIDVRAGINTKNIVVEEAHKCGAYHVVLDRTMKKDRKFFIDNLTCFVTRVRKSGGVDNIRSFAISNKSAMPRSSGSTSSDGFSSCSTFGSIDSGNFSR